MTAVTLCRVFFFNLTWLGMSDIYAFSGML